VSKGPGSFTGLRIGVSAAKGLCYALAKPLIAINSLEAMAAGTLHHPSAIIHQPFLLCPMIDARRMEVYCAIYDGQLNEIKMTSADIIDPCSFSDLLQKNKILFFGDGSGKCKNMITHANAIFIEGIHPSAEYMLPLAEKLCAEKRFEDVAYFEPFYLKDFLDTKTLSKKI
jgi:tRNA threonylcarbamoyladenosine biosynthesis protein TsaB